VVNTSIDALKKKRIPLIPIEEAYGVDTGSADDSEFSVETIDLLKNAIEKLPEGYKLVLNLHLIDELDHDEIASTLGIAASTSRSQLARAKQKLIEIIKSNKNTK
jgi:RNA polymerase sigma-70 factor (ECF subfamily)